MKLKSNYNYSQYKLYRDKLNKIIKLSKKNYYKTYFNEHQNNSKRTWNGINEIIGKHRKDKQQNITLLKKGKLITDQKVVSKTFNNYFVNIAEKLSNKLGTPSSSIEGYLDNPNKDSFYITPATPEEVVNLIDNLDPNKASDIYNIAPKFVVDSKLFLSNGICELFKSQ